VRLVFKAHRLCVSLNSRLGSNAEEEKKDLAGARERGEAVLLLLLQRAFAALNLTGYESPFGYWGADKSREWNVSKQKWNLC